LFFDYTKEFFMLPESTSKDFPEALKRAREAKGMSRAALARTAGIHQVMPRRYEDPECGEFARPTYNTWLALNKALGFESKENSISKPSESSIPLAEASTDEIVNELRKRGISVTLSFPAKTVA
jgi:ribosome-binding protein aMBF1 (putative translation factor)